MGTASPPEEAESCAVLLHGAYAVRHSVGKLRENIGFFQNKVHTFISRYKTSLMLQLWSFQLASSVLQVKALMLVGSDHPCQ